MARLYEARFPGKCAVCSAAFPKGASIYYDKDKPKNNRSWHVECHRAPEGDTDMAKLTFDEARNALMVAVNNKGEKWNTATGEMPDSLSGELRTAARRLAYSLGWTSDDIQVPGASAALKHIASASRNGVIEREARAAADWAKANLLGKAEEPKPTVETVTMKATDFATEEEVEEVIKPKRSATIERRKSPAELLQEAIEAMKVQAASEADSAPMDEARIIELIKEHAKPGETIKKVQIDLTRLDGEKVQLPPGTRHVVFEKVLKIVAAGLNLYLVGPAGSGKTTVGEQVAEALGTQFEFNGAITSKFELFGFKDANGTYHETAFRRAFEFGGVYLADEVDAWLPQPLLALNAALANGYADFPDGMVRKHPNFRMIAAANTWGQGADRQYVGRNQLDAASLDRFVFLPMEYDTQLELAISGNPEWARRVQQIRAAVFATDTRMVVSPRATLAGAKLLGVFSQSEVEDMTIWKGVAKDVKAKVLAAIR